MPLSTYLANKLGDHAFRNTSYTPPATVYAALFTTPTTDAGGGTEVTGGSYARVAVTLAAFASKASSNTADITFPTATANWGTVTHYAFYDAATSGNQLAHNPMRVPQAIASGGVAKIPTGSLSVLFN